MRHASRLAALVLVASLSDEARAGVGSDLTGNGGVSLQGLVQGDANFFDNDLVDLDGAGNRAGKDREFEVRRAELILIGKGARFDWQAGYDASAHKFLDTYLRYRMGARFLQAGQYKQINSLEELTSTRHNDFISKAMATNLFGLGRRLGVAYGTAQADWGYSVGWFGRELTPDLAHGAGFGARGYYAPVNTDGRFLHLGVSVLDHDTDADTLRLRVRPDADLATVRLIDTGELRNADRQRTLGFESVYVQGPFKVQAEWMRSQVSRYPTSSVAQSGKDFVATSWYVHGIWNISGETWTYKAGLPVTGQPDDPASGMWQLGLRYDHTDLNDDPVLGGTGQNLTVGVNWYWRSHFKFMLNYVAAASEKFNRAQARELSDDPNIVEARVQFHW